MNLQENWSISDAQVFTAECWNVKVAFRVNVKVSEDLFFSVKKRKRISFFLFLLILFFLLNSTVSCFIFIFFDYVSVTFAFCIPNIVYLKSLSLEYHVQLSIKKKRKKKTNSYDLLRAILCRMRLFFILFFLNGSPNLWSERITCEFWNSNFQGPV